jgi:uncharacterized Zn finger protein
MPFDDEKLLTLAGSGAFSRGRRYHAEGRIELMWCDDDRLEGRARGSDVYAFRLLRKKGGAWEWRCECPAADGNAFCKHLVAAVLAARGNPADEADADRSPHPARGGENCWPSSSSNRPSVWPYG